MLKCKFFIGPEMAHTNFNGLHTLFVSGFAYTSKILDLCIANSVKHVHLGYNNTFQNNKMYNQIITELFEAGLKVTLAYPSNEYNAVVDLINIDIWNNRNFVPLMTVDIGKIHVLGQNSSVQFVDTQSINPGVWSSKFASILDSNNFESESDINARVSAFTDQKEVKEPEVQEQTDPVVTTTVAEITPTAHVASSTVDIATQKLNNTPRVHKGRGANKTGNSNVKRRN